MPFPRFNAIISISHPNKGKRRNWLNCIGGAVAEQERNDSRSRKTFLILLPVGCRSRTSARAWTFSAASASAWMGSHRRTSAMEIWSPFSDCSSRCRGTNRSRSSSSSWLRRRRSCRGCSRSSASTDTRKCLNPGMSLGVSDDLPPPFIPIRRNTYIHHCLFPRLTFLASYLPLAFLPPFWCPIRFPIESRRLNINEQLKSFRESWRASMRAFSPEESWYSS